MHWTTCTLLSNASILNDCASNPMANSAMDPYSGSVFLSTLCSFFLSSIRRTTCSTVQTSFDGTVGDRMSIVVRVQREIVCFSSVPNRTLPDTESRSVAGHKTHSLVPLTPPFMDQKVVLRVLSLTRTLSFDTLFRDRAHRPLFMYPAFSLKALVVDLLLAIGLLREEMGAFLSTLVG